MNYQKNILFAALITAGMSTGNRLEGWFFDFDDFDQKIENQMKQMRDSMRTMGKQFKYAFTNAGKNRQVALDVKDNALHITIPDVAGENIEAHLDDKQPKLTITAPQLKVTIMTRHNIVGVELLEEHEIIEKEGEKESKFVTTSVSRMDQTVARDLLLDAQTIDYDQETKKLTVIIPMKEEYKGKPVAINRVKSKK